MLYPGPTGGFGELVPSPAKGHDPGLSDEQSAEAQTLVSAALGSYYTRGETACLPAGKEPSIAEGGQVQGLTSDLASRASAASLASGLALKQDLIADGGLAQTKVQNLTSDLASRATAASMDRG